MFRICMITFALTMLMNAAACRTISAELWSLTQATAHQHGIETELLAALVWQESRFCVHIVSPKGAYGLGQLMPGTAAALGVDSRDPAQNLDGAARYLVAQYDTFGSWPLALAAYNAGPGAVKKYGGIPPYAETQAYVPAVLSYYAHLKMSPPFSSPSPLEPVPWRSLSAIGAARP